MMTQRFGHWRRFWPLGAGILALIVLIPLGVGVVGRGHERAAIKDGSPAILTGGYAVSPTAAPRAAATTASGGSYASSANAAGASPAAAAAATTTSGSAAAGRAASGNVPAGSTSDAATGLNIPVSVAPTLDQKVIRNGTMTLTVKDVPATVNTIWTTASNLGGFVVSSNTRGAGNDVRGDIALRVPSENFKAAMDSIRGNAVKVEKEESNAQDVTEEYVDLSARQKNLELSVAQLQSLLGQTKTVDETLRVQAQLNSVQGDLERVKGRLNFLDNRASFSTITVSLLPVPPVPVKPTVEEAPGWSFAHSVSQAWHRSVSGLQGLADVLIAVVIGGWWLVLPLIALGIWLARSRAKRRPPLPPALVVATPTGDPPQNTVS